MRYLKPGSHTAYGAVRRRTHARPCASMRVDVRHRKSPYVDAGHCRMLIICHSALLSLT